MKTRNLVLSLIAAGLVGAGGYGAYQLGMSRGMQMAAPSGSGEQKASSVDPAAGKRVLYWHDPMVPGQKFDKPGKSPFMDMQLVPVYADGDGDEGKVTISPRVQQNLGVRVAEVTKGALAPAVEAVGSVAYNERDVAVVQARAQREEMLRAHVGEVRAMIAEWQNGRERLARYERELVPLAGERTKAALAGYQGGKTSVADLLLARRNETEVRMQAVQLEMETARLWAQLSFLIPDHELHTGDGK